MLGLLGQAPAEGTPLSPKQFNVLQRNVFHGELLENLQLLLPIYELEPNLLLNMVDQEGSGVVLDLFVVAFVSVEGKGLLRNEQVLPLD